MLKRTRFQFGFGAVTTKAAAMFVLDVVSV
jgi:hypothetical protein